MGKRTARLFCELGTVIFLLYFAKVPSVSSAPIDKSILGVMKTDSDLHCDVPRFLYNSNVTKICSNLTYPEESLKSFQNADTFLCLAFYDTWYKACDPSQLLKPFNSTSTFYSYIQKFFPDGGEESQTMFCKNVKDVVFLHKKLQPLLSLVHLKNSHVCGRMCFKWDETFNPLCAILAWSKSIDDSKKRDVVPKGNTAIKVEQRVELEVVEPEPNKSLRQGTTGKDINKDTNDAKNDPPNINQAVVTNPESVIEMSMPKILQKSSETSISKPSPVVNSDPAEKHETSNNNSPHTSKAEKEAPPNINPANVSDNLHKPSEAIHSSTNNVNNGVAENGKDTNDDVRTSTLSENTQDHEPSVNQGEWNLREEEGLDQNDDQPIEAGDQNPSGLGASGGKDTTASFHSIRPDDESHFITYFTIISMVSIAAYIGYHNKQKILAIVLEGRRARNSRGRRRPSTANYRKLDCTLEEAVTSQCNANVTHVIY